MTHSTFAIDIAQLRDFAQVANACGIEPQSVAVHFDATDSYRFETLIVQVPQDQAQQLQLMLALQDRRELWPVHSGSSPDYVLENHSQLG